MSTTSHPYFFTWSHQPATEPFPVDRAEGDEFILRDGSRVYDMISTSFQASFGHSHPQIRSAIARQLDVMPIASPKASFDLKSRVSDRLLELLGLPGGKLFYTVSGSESVENALKMARQISGRTKIMARCHSYHGASLGALSVTGDWRHASHFTVSEQTVRIPEPEDDPEGVATEQLIEQVGAEQIAALIVETVSGTNGVSTPPQTWWDKMQSLCRQHDIFLICDEVLCGFGRSGPPFALQSVQVQPDIVCMSKGITGGYIPFGAVWTGARVVEYYDQHPLVCGLTGYAHPLGLAALDGVLDTMADPSFQQRKTSLERILATRLKRWVESPNVREIRCRGLLVAIDLRAKAPEWSECFRQGLHLYSRESMVVLGPPFISDPERLTEALDRLAILLSIDES